MVYTGSSANDYDITIGDEKVNLFRKKLYANIIANLGQNPGIDGNDIMIILLEPPLENWGIRGGQPASAVDLGFDLEV